MKQEIYEAKYDEFLAVLEGGCNITDACTGMRISRSTYYNWTARDESFRLAVEKKLLSQVERVEDALFKKAMGGNVKAMLFWLANRRPSHWKFKVEGTVLHETVVHLPEFEGMSVRDLEVLEGISQRVLGVEPQVVVDTNATVIKPSGNGKHNGNGFNGPHQEP